MADMQQNPDFTQVNSWAEVHIKLITEPYSLNLGFRKLHKLTEIISLYLGKEEKC